tara:strand:+ start:1929 stop:2309 length:381 start_codon:yes stop_codon:yes gene_type:complete
MTNSTTLHEDLENLSAGTLDRHRAIASLMEELEAVDWYDQRMEAATDGELRKILAHNRDEEKEHAAMMIEWLRRNDEVFDRHLKTYLFSARSVVDLEAEDTGKADDAGDVGGTLAVGSLRQEAANE